VRATFHTCGQNSNTHQLHKQTSTTANYNNYSKANPLADINYSKANPLAHSTWLSGDWNFPGMHSRRLSYKEPTPTDTNTNTTDSNIRPSQIKFGHLHQWICILSSARSMLTPELRLLPQPAQDPHRRCFQLERGQPVAPRLAQGGRCAAACSTRAAHTASRIRPYHL